MLAPNTRSRRLDCLAWLLLAWMLPIGRAFLPRSDNRRCSPRLLSQRRDSGAGDGLRPDPMGLSSLSPDPPGKPTSDPFQRRQRSGTVSSFSRDSSNPSSSSSSFLDESYNNKNNNNNNDETRRPGNINRPPYIPQSPSSSSRSSGAASFVDKVMDKVRTSQSFPSNRQSQQQRNQSSANHNRYDRHEENPLRMAFDKFGNVMGSGTKNNSIDNNNVSGNDSGNKFGMNHIHNDDSHGPSNTKNRQMDPSAFDTEQDRGPGSLVPPFIPEGFDREPSPPFRPHDGGSPYRSGGDGRHPFRLDDDEKSSLRSGGPGSRPPMQPSDPFRPKNGVDDRWEPRRPPISSGFEPPSSFERPGVGMWEPRRTPMGDSPFDEGPPLPPRGGPPLPRGGERPPPFRAEEGPPTLFRSDGNMGNQRKVSDELMKNSSQRQPPRPQSTFESGPQPPNLGSPIPPDREGDPQRFQQWRGDGPPPMASMDIPPMDDFRGPMRDPSRSQASMDDFRGPMRGASRPQASMDMPPMDDFRGPSRGASRTDSRQMDSPDFPRERQPGGRPGSRSNDMPPNMYDLAVIGAGVVGVQAALTATQEDPTRRVVLIDAPIASGALQAPDGHDLSIGAPTGVFSKALRDTSKRINVETLRGMGLREDSVWNEIISSCLDLARNSAEDMERQLDVAGVDRVKGYASFPNSGDTFTLQVRPSLQYNDATQIKAAQILIATGSRPFLPPGIPFDGGRRVLDSDSINRLSYLPKSIAITGSGIIAVEYAKIFRNLGAAVTLIIRDQVPRKALEKIGLDKE